MKKALTYIALYIDRLIMALIPEQSINRIDLAYLDIKQKKQSITRVILLLTIISMFIFPYWGLFVSIVSAIYVVYWVVKNYIDKTKKDVI